MFRELLLTAGLSALLSGALPVFAAGPPDPYEVLNQFYGSCNPLELISALEAHKAAYLASDNRWLYNDVVGTQLSYAGDYAAALRHFDDQDEQVYQAPPGQGPAGKPEPALEALVAAARDRQVLMINEAHHMPMHRALIQQLLPRLYAQGYRYYAAETFSAHDKGLAARGFPICPMSGPYLSEPVFADTVRQALKTGFKLIPYEADYDPACAGDARHGEHCLNQRDRVQAENLISRIFKADPKAKVLVHAGYDHIVEKSSDKWIHMAEFFKAKSGIDPLSVDQVAMSGHSEPKFEHPYYRAAQDQYKLTQPVMFRSGTGWWAEPSRRQAFDAQIFHPRDKLTLGRPHWLLMNGQRGLIPITSDLCKQQFPCLVQAYHRHELKATITETVNGEICKVMPVDQVLLRGQQAPALALPSGCYELQARNSKNQIISRTDIVVADAQGPDCRVNN